MKPVEVVIARNGVLGPLHLAIPTGPGRWSCACRRQLAGDRITVWGEASGGDVWLEVRTCPECAELGERAESTTELAILAGWVSPPQWGRAPTDRPVSRLRQ